MAVGQEAIGVRSAEVVPAWRDLLLGPSGLRLEEWLRSGRAQVVKDGPHRTGGVLQRTGVGRRDEQHAEVGVRPDRLEHLACDLTRCVGGHRMLGDRRGERHRHLPYWRQRTAYSVGVPRPGTHDVIDGRPCRSADQPTTWRCSSERCVSSRRPLLSFTSP